MSRRFEYLNCLDNSQLSSVLKDNDMVFVFSYVDDWNVRRFLGFVGWRINKTLPLGNASF